MNHNLDNYILKSSFGWSWRTWSRAFLGLEKELLKNILENDGNILEVGPSEHSQVSLIFLNAKKIDLGVYKKNIKRQFLINTLEKKFINDPRIKTIDLDMRELEGKYNLIIMKSILGGIFRDGESSIDDVLNLIKKIVDNNLFEDGYLISLDNGKGFLHYFRDLYGAKKNKWRFFKQESLKTKYLIAQNNFGFLSSFSLSLRLPVVGNILENFLHIFDILFHKFFSKKISNSSVIVSVYKK